MKTGKGSSRLERLNRLTVIMCIAVSAVAVVSVITKICVKRTRLTLTDGDSTMVTYTCFTDIDGIIEEQKKKLHPYDLIDYAGYNDDGSYELSVEHSPTVRVTEDGNETTGDAVKGETVASFLEREGIETGERDRITPGLAYRLVSDTDIEITHAFSVTVTADGESRSVPALDMTVKELLDAEGITLGSSDITIPARDEAITPGTDITVRRVTTVRKETEDTVPYRTMETKTSLLKTGDSQIVTQGENGKIITTTIYEYTDGNLTACYDESINYIKPVTEVIAVGTALSEPYSKLDLGVELIDGVPAEYERVLTGKVTSYTSPPGCGTYSGRPLIIGSCGVDPDVIPFGSELYIASTDGTHVYGCAIASDTGYISDIIADVYMGITAEHWDDACGWCAQICNVYVLKSGDNTVSWRDGVKFE